MTTRLVRTAGGAALAGALLLAAVLPADAAVDTDPRWLAWTGCWVPDGGGEDHLLCVRPVEDGAAVRMVTYAEGRIVSEERVTADGQQRPVQREGCNGWESAQFSADGRRVYLRSEFACEGDVRRSSSGLISMASPMMWLDVQSVGVEGQNAVRVIRYRLAAPETLEGAGIEPVVEGRAMAVSAARTAASAPVSVAAVIDASSRLAPEAVEAWIVERGERLALNGQALLAMADAGVPASVVDIAVAVSFPNRFAVDSDARAGEYRADEPMDRSRPDHYAYPGYYDPFYWDPFRYSRYGGYYSPYGYRGGYGWYPGYNPVIVIVRPDDDSPSSPPGRVVRGRGYTRGGRTVSEPSGTGSYQSPARGGSSGKATTTSTTGSSTGSATTTRRAKPRGGTGDTGSGTGTGAL